MAEPLIRLDHVVPAVGANPALAATVWEIRRGVACAVVGGNGAGKSLLAATICGKVPLRGGQITYRFDGAADSQPRAWCYPDEVVTVSPRDQRQLTKERFHQARWHSFATLSDPLVEEFLAGGLTAASNRYQRDAPRLPGNEYEQLREDALALLQIEHLLARRVSHLSDGEGRKLLIARALMRRPHVLILDDPFAGLDPDSRATLTAAIERIVDNGAPTLLLMTTRAEEIPAAVAQRLDLEDPRHAAASTAPSSPMLPPSRPVSDGSPLVQMDAITISYGDVMVLRDLTFEVREGERWLVTGPNGAGKSTLLSLILADNPQGYAQSISLFGRNRGSGESIWEIKRRIGWMAPELARDCAANATCLSVVRGGFHAHGGAPPIEEVERDRASERTMAELGIASLAEQRFGSLSAGEQRLVLIARALVARPELLLLDEPCQALDAHNRDAIHALLDAVAPRDNLTMVYVSHHPEERPRVLTHHLDLVAGQVRYAGPIRET